ncbi:MAG: phosphoenolpyruvate kinase [Vicinamibacteria bacterium]|nr:phosphoenolpyruvate kinase [Vicinamibacteria bacterium]
MKPAKGSLSSATTRDLLRPLSKVWRKYVAAFPGDPAERQPVHSVYGGAHLFAADTAQKFSEHALQTLRDFAPHPASLASALNLDPRLADTIYERVVRKLQAEAVEDFRIDFEDGYGNRPDDEEDTHAVTAAEEVAKGYALETLPPFIGIRIKPLTAELGARSLRTMDIFISTLLARTRNRLPKGFVVTLPKIVAKEQVAITAKALAALEKANRLKPDTLRLELMVETTQSVFNPKGEVALPDLIKAGGGRIRGAHFGTYDYTAGCNITAHHQSMTHPACDFAKHVIQVSLAGTGIAISDGATNVMPVPPHKPKPGQTLSLEQDGENREAVHRVFRLHYEHVRHSLRQGFYQGWDLHPAQLPTRYAAVYAFFLEGLAESSARLRNFIERAAQATLQGEVFDDAATGQGLLNYFLRALNCGAIGLTDIEATGLSVDEIQTRSFAQILRGRRAMNHAGEVKP